MSEHERDGRRFDGVREALIALKQGEIVAEEIRDRYGDVDGVERSIAVARAKRDQCMSDEGLDAKVSIDLAD
jgi:hypothetical protein